MKLFSTNRNSRGRQLLCEDAVFDPNLIMASRVDVEEKVVSFSYEQLSVILRRRLTGSLKTGSDLPLMP